MTVAFIYSHTLARPEAMNMDMYEIHQEMKNDCGDAQERIAMEEELDPLRSPLPTGRNEWEKGFMESMKKAKQFGWTLSDKQIETLDNIRFEQGERGRYESERCGECEWLGTRCGECEREAERLHMEEWERDFAHMSEKEIEDFQDYASTVLDDRDAMSGSYGSVGRFKGPCHLSYDESGYSNGYGYAVKVSKRTGMVE